VLNNILSNAFKYTEAGRVIMKVRLEPPNKNEKNGITLVLSVQDSGHGMSKEQLEKLFEAYTRFNHEITKSIEGTGLGLPITQRIVDMMNGRINVKSELGKGTLFVVRIPQGKEGNEILGSELVANLKQFRTKYTSRRERIEVVCEPMPYGRVLIVDDMETNLYVAVGLMNLYRLKTETANSGQEAIDKATGNHYDIVFMDHMMPGMDGLEAAKRLRGMGYKKPIVALTANAVLGQAEMFLQNGFDAFISKPIDLRELDKVLDKLIRDKQPQEVLEAARTDNSAPPPPTQADAMLVESFVKDAVRTLAVIEALFPQGNFEDKGQDLAEFTTAVHGIKSALANIGKWICRLLR